MEAALAGVYGKHPIRARELQHQSDLGVQTTEVQAAVGLTGLLEAGDEGAEPIAVHEGHGLQVDQQRVVAGLDGLADLQAQLVSHCGVQHSDGMQNARSWLHGLPIDGGDCSRTRGRLGTLALPVSTGGARGLK